MAKISYYDAKRIYNNLTYLCEKILVNNLWDTYSVYTLNINSNIKKLLSFLDGAGLNKEYKTWSEDVPFFEYVYYKLLYYNDLWASTDWIQNTINLYNNRGSINDIEVSIKDVNNFVESLLMERNVIMYKQEIAKIIKGRMSGKMLNDLYRNMKIRTDNFSKINEGFYNPFDNDLLIDKSFNDNDNIINKPVNKVDRIIKQVKVYNNTSKVGGVNYKNNRVYAARTFYKGDIIEVAPVRILNDDDLYSSNVRKLVFPIDLSKRLFGIPFGIGSIARTELETNIKGNIDYEYDPDDSDTITIYATKTIRQGEELIFVDDNKMEREHNFNKTCTYSDDIIKIKSENY